MRLVPQKRKHFNVPGKTDLKYIAFGGGMNLIDSQVTMPEGMLTECLNFEQIFGRQGYSRIGGYERYDGHLEPHNASYWVQEFDTGSTEVSVGDIVTGTAASGDVLLVELESGSWAGGDAAGRLILGNVTGSWADNDAIQVTAATVAMASAATYLGSISETLNTTYKALAVEDRRAEIDPVPGSGAVLGIGVANGIVYAARNVADGTSATLYKSSISGWTAVKTGLYPGGRFRMIQANFSGSTASLYLFGCDGKNRPWKLDGSTFTFMAPIYGSQATSSTSLAIGTGSKAFTCTESTRSYSAGQSVIIWSTADATNYMAGTVSSYSDPTLTVDVTTTGGSGTFTDWEIGLADFSDKPFDLMDHKDHLFLAYPSGQLQTSNLGDPITYTTTAALFGLGDEITGLVPMKAGTMAIYCQNKTMLLSGSDKTSWQMSTNSLSSGAVKFTPKEIASNALAMDDRGVTSLQATLNYGGFEMSVFSRFVKPYVDAMRSSVVDARVVQSKNQYRMYASNGIVLSCTIMSPNPQIAPGDVAFTRSSYGVNVSCVGGGEISGEEYLLFGTDDGYVMREDVGASFDGDLISAVIRTPFWSFKSPSNKKRFRKVVMELESPQITTINFRELFDYADGNYQPSINFSTTAYGGGGQWDSDEWNTFQWSLPVQTQAEQNVAGVGRNMGLLLWHESSIDDPFSLKGVVVHYSILGLAR